MKKVVILMTDQRNTDFSEQMPQKQNADRRRSERIQTETAVRVLLENTPSPEALEGELSDFSQTGMRICIERPLRSGETILVELPHPEQDCLQLRAQVVWTELTSLGHYQTGCELCEEFTTQQFELIQELVRPAHSNF